MSWYDDFAHAITGDSALSASSGATVPAGREAEAFVAWLAECGWDRARIQRHAQAIKAGSRPWPGPQALQSDALGAAQRAALLTQVLDLLGNPQWHTERRPAHPSRPTADDLRLLREVPPHHG